jgi:hypothetical protein
MQTDIHDWVTLQEASEAVKVSATTIRDWYVSGAIESKAPSGGTRLVRLLQVQEHATGIRRNQNPRSRQRPAEGGTEEGEGTDTAAWLGRAVRDLQAVARQRLDA